MFYLIKNDKEILNDISNKIKQYRIYKKMSQEYVSKKTGISVHTISNIENGNSFSIENLIKILRVLGLLDNLNNLIPNKELGPEDAIKGLTSRERVGKTNK